MIYLVTFIAFLSFEFLSLSWLFQEWGFGNTFLYCLGTLILGSYLMRLGAQELRRFGELEMGKLMREASLGRMTLDLGGGRTRLLGGPSLILAGLLLLFPGLLSDVLGGILALVSLFFILMGRKDHGPIKKPETQERRRSHSWEGKKERDVLPPGSLDDLNFGDDERTIIDVDGK